MKVLYIDHPEGDFLAAVVYLGLCQELGSENVVDWPYKHTYHGENYVGPVPYPPPGDHGTCSPFPWMQAQPSRPWGETEVELHLDTFDLVVLASPRAYNVAALSRLMSRVGRGSFKKLVMIDGEDYTTIRWDLAEQFQPDSYFKLSMVAQPHEVYHDAKSRMAGRVRLMPITLGSPVGMRAPADKTIDVVFFGGRNWRPGPRREGVPDEGRPVLSEALAARLASEFPGFKGGIMPFDEYIDAVRHARVAVCVGGHGLEPLRTYETLSCPGTLLVRERIEVIAPHPLVEWVTHVPFDGLDWDGLVQVIKNYLGNESERARLAAQGNAYLNDYCTPRGIARSMLARS